MFWKVPYWPFLLVLKIVRTAFTQRSWSSREQFPQSHFTLRCYVFCVQMLKAVFTAGRGIWDWEMRHSEPPSRRTRCPNAGCVGSRQRPPRPLQTCLSCRQPPGAGHGALWACRLVLLSLPIPASFWLLPWKLILGVLLNKLL